MGEKAERHETRGECVSLLSFFESLAKTLLGVETKDGQYRRIRTFYRTLKQRARWFWRGFGRNATLEITTRCDSLCKYCARLSMLKKGTLVIRDITLEEHEIMINQLSDVVPPIEDVVYAGLGEPTLHKDLAEMISYSEKKIPDADSIVITNGISLNKKKGEALIEAGLDQLNISLNTFSSSLYHIMNGVDKYEDVLYNTVNFLRLKGDRNPVTQIQILDIDATRKSITRFNAFWRPLLNSNDETKIQRFENAGGEINPNDFDTSKRPIKRHPCFQLWRQVTLRPNGEVYPCCIAEIGGDSILIGNFYEENLQDILKGKKLKRLQRLHKEGKFDEIPACAVCDLWYKTVNPFFYVGGRWI